MRMKEKTAENLARYIHGYLCNFCSKNGFMRVLDLDAELLPPFACF